MSCLVVHAGYTLTITEDLIRSDEQPTMCLVQAWNDLNDDTVNVTISFSISKIHLQQARSEEGVCPCPYLERIPKL